MSTTAGVITNCRSEEREFHLAYFTKTSSSWSHLRRNPDDAPDGNLNGFNFWLTKLNSFGEDFRRAEMVKAFITAIEYASGLDCRNPESTRFGRINLRPGCFS